MQYLCLRSEGWGGKDGKNGTNGLNVHVQSELYRDFVHWWGKWMSYGRDAFLLPDDQGSCGEEVCN
jgi:hypothetical protein